MMRKELGAVTVEFEEKRGVGSILLDRPDSLNAINHQMHNQIEESLELLTQEDETSDGLALSAVTIEGAGDKAFSAGADITGFSDQNAAAFDPYTMQDAVLDFPAPIVAKIDGYCLGGGFELSLACDFRMASESSRFGFPEADIGLIPGAGGVQYISRLATPSFAKKLAMVGEHVDAVQAEEEGLINDVYPDEHLDEAVDEFVDKLASQPPLALRAIKDSGNNAVQLGLKEGRKYDRRIFSTLQDTDDHEEGVKGFEDDNYEPDFQGK